MNIWLVTIGEPVPTGSNRGDRLHRTGALAHYLAGKGHTVVWWTSTFDHFGKRHLFESDTTVLGCHGLEIRLLKGPGYRSNLSLGRIRDHRCLARKFKQAAEKDSHKPDVIVAAFPTIELSLASVELGKTAGVPVVLDMRDMWPDIFVAHAPALLRPVVRAALQPLFQETHRACVGATAIVGITDAFLDFGLRHARRARRELDACIPFGYFTSPPEPSQIAAAVTHWRGMGVPDQPKGLLAVCFSNISRQGDFETVIGAAKLLAIERPEIHFIICGVGDRLGYYQNKIRGMANILFPGWANQAQIYVLMRRASLGLDPLPDRFDFLATINNKAIEYLSAGLPVISSPERGVLFNLLRDRGCGASYRAGDATGLAMILQRVSDDANILKEMSAKAKATFDEMFTHEVIHARFLEYIETVSDCHKRRVCDGSAGTGV